MPHSLFLTVSIGISKSPRPTVRMLKTLKNVRLSNLAWANNSFDDIAKNSIENTINRNPRNSDGGYKVLQKYKNHEYKF